MGSLKNTDVLVVFGDTPLIRPETLRKMLRARRAKADPAVVVLGFEPFDPGPYGRLKSGPGGTLEGIVEAGDASASERAIALCNSGVMAIDGDVIAALVKRLKNNNAKGEYYLTDIVALARAMGRAAAYVAGDDDELIGINSRLDLAEAEAVLQGRLRLAAMRGGATLADPFSVYFSFDTRLGRDVTVGPNVVFGPGTRIGDGAVINAFCHLEGATVGKLARIGPFARLRPGAMIGNGAHVGNFVEVKNAAIAAGAKANHLSYIGDAEIGEGANIGAGTITCNYDGFTKAKIKIGRGAFIGSNTALIAPVTIGDGAVVGAGSAIATDVAAGALALTRAAQVEIEGWAGKNAKRKTAASAKAKRNTAASTKAKRAAAKKGR